MKNNNNHSNSKTNNNKNSNCNSNNNDNNNNVPSRQDRPPSCAHACYGRLGQPRRPSIR